MPRFILWISLALAPPAYGVGTCLPELLAPAVDLSALTVPDVGATAAGLDVSRAFRASHRQAVPHALVDGRWTYLLYLSDYEDDQPRWRIEFGTDADGTRALVRLAEPYDERRDLSEWRRFTHEAVIRNQGVTFLIQPRVVRHARTHDLSIHDVARALRFPLSFVPVERNGLSWVVGQVSDGRYIYVGYVVGASGWPEVEVVLEINANVAKDVLFRSARAAGGRRFLVEGGVMKGREFTLAPNLAIRLVHRGFHMQHLRRALKESTGFVPSLGPVHTHWWIAPVEDGRPGRGMVRRHDDGSFEVLGLTWTDRAMIKVYRNLRQRFGVIR